MYEILTLEEVINRAIEEYNKSLEDLDKAIISNNKELIEIKNKEFQYKRAVMVSLVYKEGY